eukprot:4083009-Amphidinium_carterae.2
MNLPESTITCKVAWTFEPYSTERETGSPLQPQSWNLLSALLAIQKCAIPMSCLAQDNMCKVHVECSGKGQVYNIQQKVHLSEPPKLHVHVSTVPALQRVEVSHQQISMTIFV